MPASWYIDLCDKEKERRRHISNLCVHFFLICYAMTVLEVFRHSCCHFFNSNLSVHVLLLLSYYPHKQAIVILLVLLFICYILS